MQRGLRKVAALGACLLALANAGCSESIGAFPSLGRMPVMDERLRSSEERKEAIRAMREEQGTHGAAAESEIEARAPDAMSEEQATRDWTAMSETERR